MSLTVSRPSDRKSARRSRPRSESRVGIRRIRHGDFFAWHELFIEHATSVDPAANPARALRVWSWLESTPPRIEGFVAEMSGRVCGFVHVQPLFVPTQGDVQLIVLDLVATPEARLHGVHDELLAAVHADAATRGIRRICTTAPEADDDLQRYWRRVAERTDLVVFDLPVQGVA